MKQKILLKLLIFLMLLTWGGAVNPIWADKYVKVTKDADLVEGDIYVIAEISTSTKFLVTAYGSKLTNVYTGFTVEENTITTSTASPLEFTLGKVDGNFTLKYDATHYLGYKGSGTDFRSVTTTALSDRWTITSSNSYSIINASVSTRSISRNSMSIGSYATSNGYPNCYLFKKQTVSATALAVKTAPTKVNYKKGEALDLTGLVLDATVGGEHVDVTSDYTASPANGTALNSVGAQTVTFTYGGQNALQTIHVGDLESIALTTTGVKTTYDEGQNFNPENLVVTATFSDGEDTPTTWTEDVTASCSYDPDGALETTDDKVTVSYTLGSTTKTADIDITVNAASAYTVTFNAGTGSCATSSLTEASAKAGVTLPTATIGVTGWSFAGWATASATNTEVEPTLYAAGDTYNPTEDCTLYAVYKFSETSATTYERATSVSDITSAEKIVIAYNDGKVLNTSVNMSTTLTETNGKVTPAANAIFTLSGDNTNGFTLTNGTNTIGATGTGSSLTIAMSSTNNLWTFSASTYGSNHFNVNNKNASGKSLEVYSSAWKAYALTASGQAWAMRIYIPAEETVYNSNPAAMVDPTIAWTTDGDKTLYLQNTSTYTNAASVTGIAKSPVYTSSDETVATVTSAGVVEALKKGTATIKATVDAEMGVNTKAEVSYVVTVKDASNVAGLKEVATSSTATSFTADLTDAVVTYVNGSYAYIEDASGAIYASCGSSLTAGKKINGAVSGSVKVSYQIDEITAIDLSGATVEDGVIPSAIVQTTAQVVANKATLEGKLVSVTGAKVTASLTSGNASGGKIKTGTDDEINLYAPASNIDALKDAEGTFNGYISLYNGGLRLNIYDQSQITLTKNAPTAQTLTFASDAVELDEETSAYSAFAGQTVSGAQGTVTYSIDSNDDGVVTSITASTGAVVLSGSCGTATIKASAAAKEVTEAGVTTPYIATTKTYTITVYPRYTVTFSANGVETPVRQASHGASVAVPSPSDVSGFKFMGWSASTVLLTDKAPTMESLSSTVTPEDDDTYYAVYAVEKSPASDGSYSLEYGVDDFTPGGYGKDVNVTANDGSSWVVRAYDNSGMQINNSKDASIKLPTCPNNITTIVVTCSSNNNFTFGTTSKGSAVATPTNNTIDLTSESYTTGYINPSSGANVITKIVVNYGVPAVYENYCTTVPAHVNIAGTAGYTTYVATDNVSFPSGTNAYIATKVNTSTIHLEEVAAVPDGTAVIVKGDKGVYLLDVEDESDCDDVSDNLLLASDGTITGGDGIYALAKKSDVVGFYPVSSDVTIPAGKAYLDLGDSDVKAFTFEFEDDADGIKTLSNSPLKGENIYNLAGQRISKMQKGINIVNGKKILK